MGRISKIFALLVFLFLMSLVLLPSLNIKAQTTGNSAPAIEWQKEYGNKQTTSVSNVIQTSDGGFAFLDLGWAHQFTFQPSSLYKVDAQGNLTWQRVLDTFSARNVTQTSDGGFQVVGFWNTYGTTYEMTPALLKTDSEGKIKWYVNDTSNVSVFHVDVSLFLLATNSFIPYIIFLSGSSAFNIIIFITISFLMNRYRKTKLTPS